MRLRYIFPVFFLCAIFPASAQTSRNVYRMEFTFARDGVVTSHLHVEITPLVQSAVQSLSQFNLPEEGNQKLTIVRAQTRRANGEIIPVSPADMVVQKGAVGQAQSYVDLTLHQIPFRGVFAGDTIELDATYEEKDHYLPGQFTRLVYALETNSHQDFEVIAHVPDGMPFFFDQRAFVHDQTQADGVTTHRWTGHFDMSANGERSPANTRAALPLAVFGTMRDFAQMGDIYASAIADKLKPSDDITKLAREITAGRDDPHAKAQAIFDWVTAHIHYVGVYFGSGRIIPNDPSTVLTRQFGDCKDHALLMNALLAAVGIDSRQALIQTQPDYELPPVAALGAFNHLIVYIPSLDLYADPTDPFSNLGALPDSDAYKPVVIVEPGRSRVARTPAAGPSGNFAHIQTRIDLADDFTATGKTTTQARGEWAETLRDFVQKRDLSGPDAAIEAILENGTRPVDVQIDAPASVDHADPYAVTIGWKSDGPLPLMKQGWLPPTGITPLDVQRSSVIQVNEAQRRKTPAQCRPGELVLDEEIALPAGVHPEPLVPPVSFATPQVKYFSGWTFADGVLSRHIRILMQSTTHFCTADEANAEIAAAQSVSDHEDIVLHFERGGENSEPQNSEAPKQASGKPGKRTP